MVRAYGGLLWLAVFAFVTPRFQGVSSSAQLVLEPPKHAQRQQMGRDRELKGKFLHITDLHPDPFYKMGASPKKPHPCHQGEGNIKSNYFGAPASNCDSPFTLVDATFRWIDENIKDEIDFVIWTGDSARHDNDKDIIRSDDQILDLNRYVVRKFVEVFGKPDSVDDPDPTDDFIIPIVPTLGNNDIFPHNIFMPGPNPWSINFVDMWRQFIPQDQRHSFARGGWFWAEVIPHRLAVISLNTLYFFSSNSAVDGCELDSEPGYEHFEWLRVQLQLMRERGMKAFMIGHVPPARTRSKRNWDESCYQKYILWQRQYRDVIVSNIYGHMNIDHFMIHDIQDLIYKVDLDEIDGESLGPDEFDPTISVDKFHTMGKAKYLNQLRDGWSTLPKPPNGIDYGSTDNVDMKSKRKDERRKRRFLKEIGGPYGERFSMSIVSPSVVPNYFPTLRIIEYNITGLNNGRSHSEKDLDYSLQTTVNDLVGRHNSKVEKKRKKKKHKKKKKGEHKIKPHFPVPASPSRSAPPGPAYSPQTLSLLSWTQLFANLTAIHEQIDMDEKLLSKVDFEARSNALYQYFDYTVEYTTHHDEAYDLPDLTVSNWLGLAERISRTVYKPSGLDVMSKSQNNTTAASDHSEEESEVANDYSETESDTIDSSKHKKHKKHKNSGKLKANKLWHEFIRRAYVHAKKEKYFRKHFD